MGYGVLIIDDEVTLAKNLCIYLTQQGYDVRQANSAEDGLAQLDVFKPDAVLLDFHLPGIDGLAALARLREIDAQVKVIMLTGHGSIELAVDAMRAGAYDFLTKPVALGKLKLLLEKALGEERIRGTLSYFTRREAQQSGLDLLVGESAPMRELKRKIVQLLDAERGLADGNGPAVLITGETGSGKELVARALHFDGPRAGGPFVELNCAALPAQLLESELFGHERGAFTDARERKLGLAESAGGGSLFLDEIGDMDLPLQAKLLKLMEEGTVRRLGSLREHKVNVRFITATHRQLEKQVADGLFRSDLFFRVRVIQLHVPPLRDRGDDILLLARHFLALQGERYGKPGLAYSSAAERTLLGHNWPGNVRELRNVVEQAVLLASGDLIEPALLPLANTAPELFDDGEWRVPTIPEEGLDLEQLERDLVRQALDKTGWNITQAARLLHLSRDTLRYRIEKFDLSAEES